MSINKFNIDYLAKQLKLNDSLKIENFLEIEFANKIQNCLENDVTWDLAYRMKGESLKIRSSEQYLTLPNDDQNIDSLDDFRFIYNSYMMVTAYLENKQPDHFLNRVLEFLNSFETINFFKEITQEKKIAKINAQATCYKSGHYLTQHDDHDEVESREYAYVLGLTKNWLPEWGGLLHIMNQEGRITNTFIPEYNSLVIFRVPQNHYVSYVTPFAKQDRLSITGWLLSN